MTYMRFFSRLATAAGLALTLASANSAMAAVISTHDLGGAGGTTLPATTTAPGYTVSPFTVVGVSGSAISNHFYFNNWGNARDPSKYLSLTISNASPYSLTDIAFSVETTSVGNASVVVRSSADNFSTDLSTFNWTGDLVTDGTLSLSSIGTRTGSTELRFYFSTQANGVQAGFANHQPPGSGSGLPDVGVDITLNGNLVAPIAAASIPTISEWGVILMSALVAMLGIARMRRRR